MIGDSLHRDIKPGNLTGFITVYKPSPYKGDEKPKDPKEEPNYRIRDLGDLIPILKNLGIPLRSTTLHSEQV
jgi:FMN phosphatase YigB (HAD superfamily)